MYTNWVRSPGMTVASRSVEVALAWAPRTSVRNDRRRADVRERDHRDVAADEVVHPAVALRACRGVGRRAHASSQRPMSSKRLPNCRLARRTEVALEQDARVRVARTCAEQVEPAESPGVDGRGQLVERHDGFSVVVMPSCSRSWACRAVAAALGSGR